MKRYFILILSVLIFLNGNAQNFKDTLKKHVDFLTKESLDGRRAGSSGEREVADSLYNYMLSINALLLSPQDGDDFQIASDSIKLQSRNIVALFPGYDPKLKDEFIVIGAHYDGAIHPSADNNASGVATLMQVAKMISQNRFVFRRSVIVAFFGAGEYSNSGSWYFLNRSFAEDTSKIAFMIDINSVGHSGEEFPFQVFLGIPTNEIKSVVNSVSNRPFSLTAKIIGQEPFASDYRNFYEKNIPVSLFTTGYYKYRSTQRDTPDLLDYMQMNQIAEYIYSYSLVVANLDNFEESVVDEEIYSQNRVEKRATFMKGDERNFLKDWVYTYITYPDSAVKAGTQGKVEVEFIVDKNGNVVEPRIIKGLDEDIDREVIKVIKASPKWTPATIGGERVSVKISVAVEFRLTKSGKVGFKR